MTTAAHILVCGVNWVGDTIMTLPALQAYRAAHPDHRITLLIKPGLRALWSLSDVPDDIVSLRGGLRGTWTTAREVARRACDRAYVLPHSLRSACIPWLARVPERIGMPGHHRDWMLTRVMPLGADLRDRHQAYEYVHLLTPDRLNMPLDPPRLSIPEELRARALALLDGLPSYRIGLIPGAARGPSKRWPAAHFAELGRRLVSDWGAGLAVLGTAQEQDLCESVRAAAGDRAVNLAGRTRLDEWAAVLGACDLVVANDSGGMHVASALGVPVAALYGATDPGKTGPLGDRRRILQNSPVRRRDIARHSRAGQETLASISPDQALEACEQLRAET